MVVKNEIKLAISILCENCYFKSDYGGVLMTIVFGSLFIPDNLAFAKDIKLHRSMVQMCWGANYTRI